MGRTGCYRYVTATGASSPWLIKFSAPSVLSSCEAACLMLDGSRRIIFWREKMHDIRSAMLKFKLHVYMVDMYLPVDTLLTPT